MAAKRSIYLIDPGFQLRISLFVSLVVLISGIFYPFTLYGVFEKVIDQVSGPNFVQNTEMLKQNLEKNKSKLFMAQMLYHFCFTLLVFIVSIFQTHRIAGPIYKLRQALANIIKDKASTHLFFRKGDHFQEVATEFNDAFNRLNMVQSDDQKVIGDILDYLEENKSDERAQKLISKLETIKSRKS